jgi:hypothetical protein
MAPIDRARVGIGGAIALLVVACATGAAPESGSLDQREHAPGEPSQTPTSGAGEVRDGGSPVTTPGPDAEPAEASTPPAFDSGPTTCSKTLTIPSVSLSNGVCTDINTKVTKGPATLSYPCAGGAASVTFGAQTFTGTVTSSQLQVTNVAKFTLGPCELESTQTISGNLGAPPLAYAYGERFVGGDCSGFIICKASGKVGVQ